jgi:hypothetical protein
MKLALPIDRERGMPCPIKVHLSFIYTFSALLKR